MKRFQTRLRCALAVIVTSSLATTIYSQDLSDSASFANVESVIFIRGAAVDDEAMDDGRKAHSGPDWDEGPAHQVEVSAFRIARRQVTMGQLAAFLPAYRKRVELHGGTWENGSPAVFVSWNEANAYCDWKSLRMNRHYRLPTEAEWELAASQSDKLNLLEIADGVQEWCLVVRYTLILG